MLCMKVNIELPYDPAIPVLGVCPKQLKTNSNKYMYTHVQSRTIHKSQMLETVQMATSGWMDKLNMIYPYNVLLFSLKKERSADLCYSMDEP